MLDYETHAPGERVIVTGSQGFVGRHVRAALVRRGLACVGVDRPGSGAEVEVDLGDPSFDAARLWDTVGPARSVIWMAAYISRTSSVDAAARSNIRVIAEAMVRFAEEGAARGLCHHVVDCSTFKIYGVQRQPLIVAATHPRRPDPFSYGSAKALGERLLAIGALRSGFTYAVVHSACIYGPGQHLHNAIPIFIRAALSGEGPTVFGEGTSVRDDVYVGDLGDTLVEAGLRRATGSFHAGGERSRTIFEVAELCCEAVARITGGRALAPRREPGTSPKWWLDQRFDLGSTRATFGYAPTPMLEGLEAEVRWMMAGAPRESERFATASPASGVSP